MLYSKHVSHSVSASYLWVGSGRRSSSTSWAVFSHTRQQGQNPIASYIFRGFSRIISTIMLRKILLWNIYQTPLIETFHMSVDHSESSRCPKWPHTQLAHDPLLMSETSCRAFSRRQEMFSVVCNVVVEYSVGVDGCIEGHMSTTPAQHTLPVFFSECPDSRGHWQSHALESRHEPQNHYTVTLISSGIMPLVLAVPLPPPHLSSPDTQWTHFTPLSHLSITALRCWNPTHTCRMHLNWLISCLTN